MLRRLCVPGENRSTQVPDYLMDGHEGGGGGLFSLFAISVLPPSFNSQMGCVITQLVASWASDQRIQYAAFEGIKEKTPAG